jgi:cytochrome d ubiquinol oxidase subunit I
MAVSTLQWLRGKLSAEQIGGQKWLLRGWILAAPLGYIATDSGWIVRCVGRQPWTVYGQIRTVDAASHIPAGEVFTSLIGFVVLYSVLLATTLYFGRRIILAGPNLELPLPSLDMPLLREDRADLQPDQRPSEAQP